MIHPVLEVQRGCSCHQLLEMLNSTSSSRRIAWKWLHSCQKCLVEALGCEQNWQALLSGCSALPLYLRVGVKVAPPLQILRQRLSSSSKPCPPFPDRMGHGFDVSLIEALGVSPGSSHAWGPELQSFHPGCYPDSAHLASWIKILPPTPCSKLLSGSVSGCNHCLSSAPCAGKSRYTLPSPKTGLRPK